MNKATGFSARMLIFAVLFSILIIPFIASIATAATISFSPLNLDDETLLFHNSSGTLIGVYNTSSKGIVLDNNESYSILVQPQSSNLLTNHPDTWFANFIDFLQARSIGLIIAFFLVALLIMAYRRR